MVPGNMFRDLVSKLNENCIRRKNKVLKTSKLGTKRELRLDSTRTRNLKSETYIDTTITAILVTFPVDYFLNTVILGNGC